MISAFDASFMLHPIDVSVHVVGIDFLRYLNFSLITLKLLNLIMNNFLKMKQNLTKIVSFLIYAVVYNKL